jgi:hypothetical protein
MNDEPEATDPRLRHYSEIISFLEYETCATLNQGTTKDCGGPPQWLLQTTCLVNAATVLAGFKLALIRFIGTQHNFRVADKQGVRLAWWRGAGKGFDGIQLVSGLFLKVSRVLDFALRGALGVVRLYQHLVLLAAARVVGVGEFEQFDGRAVFDYECDADAVGWAVGRNQDFEASKLGGEISHFKRDVRNVPD